VLQTINAYWDPFYTLVESFTIAAACEGRLVFVNAGHELFPDRTMAKVCGVAMYK
jgi:hypothetical protein